MACFRVYSIHVYILCIYINTHVDIVYGGIFLYTIVLLLIFLILYLYIPMRVIVCARACITRH